ncbi:MAG TPA: hypothetical protein VND95_17795 [Stellaceae bacterium]|nr:hypothetical protein [Stellaceae bacterium]
MNRFAIALVAFAFAFAPAMASQPGLVVTKNWKLMDQCAQAARAAFPDYTAEANAKREAKLKECLESKNLPPN